MSQTPQPTSEDRVGELETWLAFSMFSPCSQWLLKPAQITPHPVQYPAMADNSKWKPKSWTEASWVLQALSPWSSWLFSHTFLLCQLHSSSYQPSYLSNTSGTPGLWCVSQPLSRMFFPKYLFGLFPQSLTSFKSEPSLFPLSLPYIPFSYFHHRMYIPSLLSSH